MWNKKRLDDLEKKVTALENERVYIPGENIHYNLFSDGFRRTYPWFSIPEALSIVIDYLRLTVHKEPAKNVVTGTLDKEGVEDTNG